MQHPFSSDNRQGLRLIRRCAMCDTSLANDDIALVDEDAGVHLFHIACSVCAHAVLSFVTVSPFGMSSVGMSTDLSAEDVNRMMGAHPITDDEMLSFHEYLHTGAETTHTLETHLFLD